MASFNFHKLSLIASFRILRTDLKYLNTAIPVSAVIAIGHKRTRIFSS